MKLLVGIFSVLAIVSTTCSAAVADDTSTKDAATMENAYNTLREQDPCSPKALELATNLVKTAHELQSIQVSSGKSGDSNITDLAFNTEALSSVCLKSN